MIYAVVSDIHANLEALTAVLESADAQGAQQVLCLGDVVGYCTGANECVRLIHQRSVPGVAGNHDLAAIGDAALDGFCESARRALRWTRRELTEENVAVLRNWPLLRDMEGGRVLLVHASPHPRPNAETRLDSPSAVEQAFQAMRQNHPQARVCFFGHTHRPAAYAWRDGVVREISHDAFRLEDDELYLINPGTVGMPREADRQAQFLIHDTSERTVRFCRVPHDWQRCHDKAVAEGLVYRPSLRGRLARWVVPAGVREYSCQDGALRAELMTELTPQRRQCERDLIGAGIAVPLPHCCAWAETAGRIRNWFLAVRREDGGCIGGMAVEAIPSRVLPGHLLLRVQRLGATLPPAAAPLGLKALAELARRDRRIVRVNVEVFSRESAMRETLGQSLASLGFQPVSDMRSYADTIAVDLSAEESAIFASLHQTARRHIRSVARHPVAIAPIDDFKFGRRLTELLCETMQRTGGVSHLKDWDQIISLSRLHPERSRLIGLFRTDAGGPDSLLAFAWGCAHGDCVHYDAAASTRAGGVRLPMAYPLVWDLIRWAKSTGAKWFDFGGITAGAFGGADPLGGISDFKRYFSKDVVRVGEEWVFHPRPLRSSLAAKLSACVGGVRRLRQRPVQTR